jgi:hypothetical protein
MRRVCDAIVAFGARSISYNTLVNGISARALHIINDKYMTFVEETKHAHPFAIGIKHGIWRIGLVLVKEVSGFYEGNVTGLRGGGDGHGKGASDKRDEADGENDAHADIGRNGRKNRK